MRGVVQKPVSLARRFRNELEFPIFEIAQTAMCHARGSTRRAAAKVGIVDEKSRDAVQREFAQDSDAIHATAQNEHVKTLAGRKPRQAFLPNSHNISHRTARGHPRLRVHLRRYIANGFYKSQTRFTFIKYRLFQKCATMAPQEKTIPALRSATIWWTRPIVRVETGNVTGSSCRDRIGREKLTGGHSQQCDKRPSCWPSSVYRL